MGFGGNNYPESTLSRVAAAPNQNHSREIAPPRTRVQDERKAVGEESSRLTTAVMESNIQGLEETNLKSPRFGVTSIPRESGVDFEAMLKDIDNDILGNRQSTNTVVKEIVRHLNGEDTDIARLSGEDQDSKIGVGGALEKGTKFKGFQMGWSEKKAGNKEVKTGKKEGQKKQLVLKDSISGPNNKPNGPQKITKGSWTRFPYKPLENMEVEAQGSGIGMKRKTDGAEGSEEGRVGNEKKQKLEEEAKKLSMLFATHLGAAEVANQLRRAQ